VTRIPLFERVNISRDLKAGIYPGTKPLREEVGNGRRDRCAKIASVVARYRRSSEIRESEKCRSNDYSRSTRSKFKRTRKRGHFAPSPRGSREYLPRTLSGIQWRLSANLRALRATALFVFRSKVRKWCIRCGGCWLAGSRRARARS